MEYSEREALKKSFNKIKDNMLYFYKKIISLQNEINIINSNMIKIQEEFNQIKLISAHTQQINENPAQNVYYNNDIRSNSDISIGNEGVPADRQQTSSTLEKAKNSLKNEDLSIILEKLKLDLKQKFKNLTNQEILIFSIIYTLNEERENITYKDIALRAKLTESSIRDYIARLEHKGIPLIKEKRNNKTVIIKIPQELKHLSTLDNLNKLINKGKI